MRAMSSSLGNASISGMSLGSKVNIRQLKKVEWSLWCWCFCGSARVILWPSLLSLFREQGALHSWIIFLILGYIIVYPNCDVPSAVVRQKSVLEQNLVMCDVTSCSRKPSHKFPFHHNDFCSTRRMAFGCGLWSYQFCWVYLREHSICFSSVSVQHLVLLWLMCHVCGNDATQLGVDFHISNLFDAAFKSFFDYPFSWRLRFHSS